MSTIKNIAKIKQDSSSLFTPKNRGGKIGGDGYNFQDSFTTPKILEWLDIPEFQSYLKEATDDVAVHFDYNGQARTWLYQMKKFVIDKNELTKLLSHFTEKLGHPGLNVEKCFIGCCGLDEEIKTLWNLISEYRGALISMTREQLEPTKVELCAKIAAFGLNEYQDLLLSKVIVESGYQGLQENDIPALQNSFAGEFIRTKFYKQEGAEIIDRLFRSLCLNVNKKTRVGVTRSELEEIIRTELVNAKKGHGTVIYLHGWIKQAYEDTADITIDWTRYFDHSTLKIPDHEVWQKELLPELTAIRKKLDMEGSKRNIWLRSKASLSAGIAFGNAFPEALGYNIQIEQPSPGAAKAIQYWQTDTPDERQMTLNKLVIQGNKASKNLVVAIGVTDDPKPKVEEFYKVHNSIFVPPFIFIHRPDQAILVLTNNRQLGLLVPRRKRYGALALNFYLA